jgi:hypothetical protein
MRILGYGEDALTYWALSGHLPEVIGPPPLGDASAEENSLVIYRPSFGRAGGPESAQFGEFDAIVGTPRATYLLESKWTGERIINGQIRLATRQVLRHQVFRWIRGQWLQQAPTNWEQFYNANSDAFADHFRRDGKLLPRPPSRLACNLQHVLQELRGCGAATRDVLLYFCLEEDGPQGVADAPSFDVVRFPFHPLNADCGGRVIVMQA